MYVVNVGNVYIPGQSGLISENHPGKIEEM